MASRPVRILALAVAALGAAAAARAALASGEVHVWETQEVALESSRAYAAEALGGGDVHTRVSGVADHLAETEQEALEKVRDIVSHLQPGIAGRQRSIPLASQSPEEPHYSADELYGVIPADPRMVYDVREVIARLVDGSRLSEFKPRYGPTIVCGFAHIMGIPVGIVANNGLLFSESALKATHFIQLCGQRGTPLLFMQNIAGFMVGKQYENEGIAKHGAKMVMAVSNVNVPRITLLHGVSHGAGNYGMSGRAYDPRFLFSWPNSRISVMSGDSAADTLWMVGKKQVFHQMDEPTESEVRLAEEKFKQPILDQYNREGDPYFATARLWDDGILDPVKTRVALGLAFAATANAPLPEAGYGTFRM